MDDLSKLEARVKALMDKADSTEFEEEAETFRAKAIDMISKYGIDEARLRMASGENQDEIVTKMVYVEGSYKREQQRLLGCLLEVMHCAGVDYTDGRGSLVYGTRGAVERATMLFYLVVPQMRKATEAAERPTLDPQSFEAFLGRVMDFDKTPGEKSAETRKFRASFAMGFAMRVGERALEIENRNLDTEREEYGGGAALVLVTDQQRAASKIKEDFADKLVDRKAKEYTHEGLVAGSEAGDRADLGHNGITGGHKELA